MPLATTLLLAWVVVFLVNLVPAFMPPTWSILAFFLIQFDLPLLPLAIGGAVAATLGRLALALGARWLGPKFLPDDTLRNLGDLGAFLRTRQRWVGPAVLLYSFGPIPSNQLFMAAGLARLDLRVVGGAFFVGRVVSYTFFSHVADKAVDSLTDVFAQSVTSPPMLLLELASLAILMAIAKIPWGRLLGVASPVAPTSPRTH
jgi:membrane protein YqaA with SNARE-associated domain